jgi:hypothetical protein
LWFVTVPKRRRAGVLATRYKVNLLSPSFEHPRRFIPEKPKLKYEKSPIDAFQG